MATNYTVKFVTQYYGRARGGLGHYEEVLLPMLQRRIPADPISIQPISVPRWLIDIGNLMGRDFFAVSQNIPCKVGPIQKQSLYHLSNQTLAPTLIAQELPFSVVTVHDIIPYVQLRKRLMTQQGNRWFDAAMVLTWANCLRRATRIIADSTYTKLDLVRHLRINPDKIDVVFLGVDVEFYRPLDRASLLHKLGLSPRKNYILYVGSQDSRKNLSTLLHAMALLKSVYPDLILLIVGAPRLSQHTSHKHLHITELINVLNLTERVRFTGFIPTEQLPEYYSIADVFVFPSLYEGFGLPILESMACSCPVVAANATSLPEIAGGAASLVAPLDPSVYAEEIGILLDNPRHRAQMIEAGFARAHECTWDKTISFTIETYEKTLDCY